MKSNEELFQEWWDKEGREESKSPTESRFSYTMRGFIAGRAEGKREALRAVQDHLPLNWRILSDERGALYGFIDACLAELEKEQGDAES